MGEHVLDGVRPEPVLDAAKLAGRVQALVTAVGGILVLLGLATAGDIEGWALAASAIVLAVVDLLAYLLPVWQARKARQEVTPLADPRDEDGLPLEPVPTPLV